MKAQYLKNFFIRVCYYLMAVEVVEHLRSRGVNALRLEGSRDWNKL